MSLSTAFRRRPLLIGLLGLLAMLLGGGFGLLFALAHDLPQVRALDDYQPEVVTTILDRNGETIAELYKERRVRIPFDQLPKPLVEALVATEDHEFFTHRGIRFGAILRALLVDLRRGRMVQGGSTITQQLAKLLFLSSEKTVIRKVREALLAIDLENRYTKEEILELYCNQVYLGSGAYGFEAAAREYFGKGVAEVTLTEAALLAGLPQAPSRYSPRVHPDLAAQRRATVLARMRAEGYVPAEQEREANAAPVTLASRRGESVAGYVVGEVRKELARRYGEQGMYREGVTVTTTIDLALQRAAERTLREGVERLRRQYPRAGDQLQGALVALDPATGGILAMAGGTDYAATPFNRGVAAHRQPGSSFKPFVYLAALESGFTPADIILDAPLSLPGPDGTGSWEPENFGHRFHGPVTLRSALERSLNVATVRLADKVGIDTVIGVARALGIRSPLARNLTLALGSSGVTPLEMASAYGAIANGGIRNAPTLVERIDGPDGAERFHAGPDAADALRPEEAYVMTRMLAGVVERGTGAVARKLGRPAAGKTGTASDYRDAWFVGYTPRIATAVWVGRDDNLPLGSGATGGEAAGPIWTAFMQEAVAGTPVADFTAPEGVTVRLIDRQSGKLATGACRETLREVFVAGSEPTLWCDLESAENREPRP